MRLSQRVNELKPQTGGSSLPGAVQFFSGTSVSKAGLDDAITVPTSFGSRFKVPASPGVVAGGLSTTATGIEFSDGTNTAILTTTLPAAGKEIVAGIEFSGGAMRVGRLA